MNKKLYTTPSVEIIHVDSADTICTSPEPMTFSLIDGESDIDEDDVW